MTACKLHGKAACGYCAQRVLEAQVTRLQPTKRSAYFQTIQPSNRGSMRGTNR
jgi:hypothetical protein